VVVIGMLDAANFGGGGCWPGLWLTCESWLSRRRAASLLQQVTSVQAVAAESELPIVIE
jgi:hypothetical protein